MRWRWVVVLLLFPFSVGADDFVCGDTTRLTRYLPSVDPSTVTDGTCSVIPEADTPAQRVLLQTISRRYLKVVEGLAVEMSQGEKDAVDAALAAAAAAVQAYLDELATSDVCSVANFAAVETALDTRHNALAAQINAVGTLNLTTFKAALHGINDELTTVQKKVARCLFALRRLIRP
jgi:hypothetical protein